MLLLDDLLATGGTLKCAEDLIKKAGLEKPVANAILFEILSLKGREKLSSPVVTLVTLND